MQILDKTQTKSPWEQMTVEERVAALKQGPLLEWMFEQKTILTLVDKEGQVSQWGEIPLEPVKYSRGAVLKKKVRRWFRGLNGWAHQTSK